MTVFIANFGQENDLWPKCLEQGTVATINREDVQPFWEKGDRKGVIEFTLTNIKSARGQTPNRQVVRREMAALQKGRYQAAVFVRRRPSTNAASAIAS